MTRRSNEPVESSLPLSLDDMFSLNLVVPFSKVSLLTSLSSLVRLGLNTDIREAQKARGSRPELGQLRVQSYSQSPHCPCVSLCGDISFSVSLRSFVATDHKDVSEKVTFCRSRDKSSQSSLAQPYLSTAISSVSSFVLSCTQCSTSFF